ncbi:hypothetical protein KFK09_012712 [Dendrobium nobile]|uniref:Uncharacterized protein n=1 Tax=Dendrobium nobile TaxID=94219 RepID=A0A8T3BIL1_DENNO|nr:hypothetical protein KFK09_012712 [Dendrobium nobile]
MHHCNNLTKKPAETEQRKLQNRARLGSFAPEYEKTLTPKGTSHFTTCRSKEKEKKGKKMRDTNSERGKCSC